MYGGHIGKLGFWELDAREVFPVGTPDYPSGIPDMHTIHDPMISVSWIHIFELITELHHPLQYRVIYLQLVTWPSIILPRRASLPLSSGYQAALMTHVMPTTLQATDWETFLVHTGAIGPSPSSSNSCSRSDQVNSQGQSREYIWIVLANHLKGSEQICNLAIARRKALI
jgi:hypothetical protein